MSYGTLGDYKRRRQRAVYLRFLQFALFVTTLLGTASYAYQVGVSATQATSDKLEAQVERFQSDNLALRDRLAAETRRSSDLRRSFDQLEARYLRDVPTGELRSLMDQLEAQIASGTGADRLALMIEFAGHPPLCDQPPETKRFIASTPIDSGVVNAVRFAGGRILVKGEGDSAQSEQGLPEAWYDPAAPVRLTFSTLAGAAEEVSGVLPLHHNMIVDGVEYRFAITSGERAFVEVTAQGCELPGLAPGQARNEGDQNRAAVTSG